MKRIFVLVLVLCTVAVASFAAGGQEGGKVTLTLMHFRSELTAEYNALFAEFTKANPNIKVEAQMLGSWESAFKTRRAANELADVIMIHSGAEIVETARGGYLEDLSSQSFMKSVPRGVLDTVTVDKKDYMLPIVAHNAVPFYNVDLFAKYKVKPPTNWDELLAACETFKANGVTPVTWEFGDAYNTTFAAWDIFGAVAGTDCLPMGERIFKGNSTFSSEPAFLKAVDRMLTFKKKGYIPEGAEGMNIDQALSHFGTGKAAMFFGGAWYYSSLTKANADLNILPMPMPANDKGTLSIIDSVLEGLTINSKAKEKAAAAKLLAWFGTPEVAAKHLQFSGGGSTPIRGASEFIPDTRATKSIRELGKYVEQMGSVRFDQQPYTPTAFGRDVQSRIFDVIRETMVTGGTAQDVAKQLDELLKQTK